MWGLCLPAPNFSQGDRDSVSSQKSQNPGEGGVLGTPGPRPPHSHSGTLRLWCGWSGGGLHWVTQLGDLLRTASWGLALRVWVAVEAPSPAFQVRSCLRGESAVGSGTHPGLRNSASSLLIRWVDFPEKSQRITGGGSGESPDSAPPEELVKTSS